MLVLGTIALASCSTSKNAQLEPAPTAVQDQKITDNQDRISWLNKLQPSTEVTPFQVEIHSTAGEKLITLTQLQPDSDYTLVIKSETPCRFTLKATSGFTALSQSQRMHKLNAATQLNIPIHTDAELPTPPYVSVVPIHTQGNSFTKEKPKSFLLLNQ
jgi:hypothetical protein